jgi:hypothetical protein
MDFSSYKLLHPFQIVGHFDFSKFIDIIMHLDIHYTPSDSTKVVVLESKPSAEKESLCVSCAILDDVAPACVSSSAPE